ncbi:MAG: hypothetical protein F4Z01_02835 [Gammaproteobacteria bacterium]|nr:hypothetical protein [Gammaproteobacteria bacterium]MYF39016.1 hypothetical protein [Gammaproteobacteria bacterium]
MKNFWKVIVSLLLGALITPLFLLLVFLCSFGLILVPIGMLGTWSLWLGVFITFTTSSCAVYEGLFSKKEKK